MRVWLLFQTKEALFAALRLTFYVNYNRLLQLMVIIRSVSDSTRVDRALLVEAFSLFYFCMKLFNVSANKLSLSLSYMKL